MTPEFLIGLGVGLGIINKLSLIAAQLGRKTQEREAGLAGILGLLLVIGGLIWWEVTWLG